MNDIEKQQSLREFAERIISGEYTTVVIALVRETDDDDNIDLLYDGSACTALGLADLLQYDIRKSMLEHE